MTRDEAIRRIKAHKAIHKMDEPRAIYISEALDMAIEALEAWDDVTAEFAMAVPWCIDTEEDRAYMEGLNTGYYIVQKHLKEVEDDKGKGN